jgi:hypothetical protein
MKKCSVTVSVICLHKIYQPDIFKKAVPDLAFLLPVFRVETESFHFSRKLSLFVTEVLQKLLKFH